MFRLKSRSGVKHDFSNPATWSPEKAQVTRFGDPIKVVPIMMQPIGSVAKMRTDTINTIRAVTGVDVLLDRLPVDEPTAEEISRGYWYRRMHVNRATGEVEVEVIHDIYDC